MSGNISIVVQIRLHRCKWYTHEWIGILQADLKSVAGRPRLINGAFGGFGILLRFIGKMSVTDWELIERYARTKADDALPSWCEGI